MPNRLITIPISHFCEKARWALHRAGVEYREEPHVQGVHMLHSRLAGGGITVPVLVLEDGRVLSDSSDILRFADEKLGGALYPQGGEAAALEQRLDAGLGPDGRLWLYAQTLSHVKELTPWILHGTPRWERYMLSGGGFLAGGFITRRLGVSAARAAVAIANVDAVFDEIAARMKDGRRFLCGDEFTAADLTFGALSAAVLVPEGYGSPLPPIERMPPTAAAKMRELREHPAGRFASRLYEDERWRASLPASALHTP